MAEYQVQLQHENADGYKVNIYPIVTSLDVMVGEVETPTILQLPGVKKEETLKTSLENIKLYLSNLSNIAIYHRKVSNSLVNESDIDLATSKAVFDLKKIVDDDRLDIAKKAPNIHSSDIADEYGSGTDDKYGHVKLSDVYDEELTGGSAKMSMGVSQLAVYNTYKTLNDLITTKITNLSDKLSSHIHDDRYYTESEVDAKLSDKAASSHTHSKSDIGLGNVDNTADDQKSVKYATSAGSSSSCSGNSATATTAAKLGRNGNTGTPMVFNWSGQGGQPPWLWGGSDGTNMYVYNPANFSVNYSNSAGKATGVADYGDTSRTITIGYSGAGASTSNLSHIAGYLTGGTQIKDVSKDVLKSWLGLGSRAYDSTSYLPLGGGTVSGDTRFRWNLYLGDSAYTFLTASGTTLSVIASSYLNLRSPGIQCRNYGDSAWTGISASSFTTQYNSSRLLKDNIKDISDERAKQILGVRVVTYDYKEGIVDDLYRFNRTGVISQEMVEKFPEVVNYDNGEPSGVQYDRFIPSLIKMVQIQAEEIKNLKETFQKITNNIAL